MRYASSQSGPLAGRAEADGEGGVAGQTDQDGRCHSARGILWP